jgi:hypothetical protein
MTSTEQAPEPVQATVLRESRTDRAERTIELHGAPLIEYTSSGTWRQPEPQVRTWRPKNLRLTWDLGRLHAVFAGGVRMKKDGTEGATRESTVWRMVNGTLVSDVKHEPAPEWVQAIAKEHGDPPPFKSFVRVGA